MPMHRTLVGILVVVALLVGPLAWSAPFPDTDDHWARVEISRLTASRVIDGYPDQRFHPEDPVTRSQFAKMITTALEEAADAANLSSLPSSFPDVNHYHWAKGYLEAAYELGIMRGDQAGAANPDLLISRAEVVVMLLRALNLESLAAEYANAPLSFTDAHTIPGWAWGHIALAQRLGLVKGYNDGGFHQADTTSRAQAAVLVARLRDYLGYSYGHTGLILSLDRVNREMMVRTGSGVHRVYRVSPGASLFRHGRDATLDDLKPLDQVRLTLDPHGLVTHLEAASQSVAGRLVATNSYDGQLQLVPLKAPDGEVTPLPTQEITLSGQVIIYRHGQPAGLADLRPGDRVYCLLDSQTGLALLVDAAAVHLSGEIQSVVRVDDSWQLSLAAAEETMPFAANPTVFLNGQPSSPDQLQAGDQVTAALDENLAIIYLEALRDTSAGGAAQRLRPVVAAITGQPNPTQQAAASLALSRQILGLPSELVPGDGRGQTIAIIDSGVDVANPDLSTTTAGTRKITEWVDFTGEGDVETNLTGAMVWGKLKTPWGTYRLGSVPSVSGHYRYGLFRESQLAAGSPLKQDINRNGSSNDQFLVMVIDSKVAGVYDTVYVDTDMDFDLSDEVALRPYSVSQQIAYFGDSGRAVEERVAFIVTRIHRDGLGVNLGFDGNGHGTQVAAVAAANGRTPDAMRGIAPGASVMALKALDSAGNGTWDNIVTAVEYAASRGAKIISLSLAVSNDSSGRYSRESQELNDIARRYDCLIILAAGNTGPGLGSAFAPGDADWVLTVGAYMSTEMWSSNYGYTVPQETLLYFSAIGPQRDGTMTPGLVAPGSLWSAVPRWLDPRGVQLYEGTSLAVPHVAGAAARLWDTALQAGISPNAAMVKRALEVGARPLAGYGPVEQGHGLLSIPGAMQALGNMAWAGRITATSYATGWPTGGTYGREYYPGRVLYYLYNDVDRDLVLELNSTVPWVRFDRTRLHIPAKTERTLTLEYDTGLPPGLHSALITGTDPDTHGPDLEILTTITVPFELGPGQWSHRVVAEIPAGRLERYFFRIPQGLQGFDVTLSVPVDTQGKRLGRVRAYLFRPDGQQLWESPNLGVGVSATSRTRSVDYPMPGVWELVVYSSAMIGNGGLSASQVEFTLQARGFQAELGPLAAKEGLLGGDLTIHPLADQTLQISAPGLTGQPLVHGDELHSTGGGQGVTISLPAVPEGCRYLQVRVANPAVAGADLDLYLYREEADEQLALVGSSAATNVSLETVALADPAPGLYYAHVEGYGLGENPTFELKYVMAGGEPAQPQEVAVGHLTGAVQHPLQWPLPDAASHYGLVIITDRLGQSLVLPVAVQTGLPELWVELGHAPLEEGWPGYATLFVHDAEAGWPADLPVTVNGVLYEAVDGRIRLPVTMTGSRLLLEVEIASEGFATYRRTFVLEAGPGVLSSGEAMPDWCRQKVASQLRPE
ncbi:MAG: S8 family serine peptidase [Bacillota bacterium]